MNQFRFMFRKRRNAWVNAIKPNGELTESGETILADLRTFCRGNASTHIPNDPYSSANLEGRREVFLRICTYLNVTEEVIFNLREDLANDGSNSTDDPAKWGV